ncbi:Chloride Channel (ClC) Family [Achlya hypogyna]|uniref:Chloride Channel (ClC) Family n=1 Tax=Achlya hypogyna TaxID=1202772 RepID=A0A1V9Z4I5_ACHHY|nr:Chloride Channel (ClC) Family [Achlya hypogyna]
MRDDIWRQAKSLEEYQHKMRTSRRRSSGSGRPSTMGRRVWAACMSLPHSPITWLFLMTLGCLSALIGALLDAWIVIIVSYRSRLVDTWGEDSFASFCTWTVWTIGLGLLSSMCGVYLSAHSDGSGIPQMKALLAGQLTSADVLSYATLLGRSVGTVLSNASGLSVGKEGPFIHLVSIVAHKLSLLELFGGTDNITYIRAGVACGVTAVFGSPLGGVLFSIEVTSQFYAIKYCPYPSAAGAMELRNLWQSVISSSICVLTFQIVSALKNDVLFTNTTFADFVLGPELIAFLLLGCLCGGLSAAFVRGAIVLQKLQSILLQPIAVKGSRKHRCLLVAGACTATAVLAFPFLHLLRFSDRMIINEAFRDLPIADTELVSAGHIALLILFKFAMTLLPCGLPLSCGIFTPLFALGAVVGRLYGEVLRALVSSTVSPATYAVVGAASLASAATHSISTAVIVFELTGQLSHMLPVMLSVLVAYSVGGMFTPSIYDVFAKLAGLDFVCDDISDKVLADKVAADALQPVGGVLTLRSTYAHAASLLVDYPQYQHFALCDSAEGLVLMGGVRRADLVTALARLRARHCEVSNEADPMHHRTSAQIAGYSRALDAGLLALDDASDSLASTTLEFGPPFSAMSYAALPVDTYPPQVGPLVSLDKVYVLSCLYLWTQIFVVKEGVLQGAVFMDATLAQTCMQS